LAAFVWLLSHRPWYRAFLLVGVIAGLGLGFFFLINGLTQGGFMFHTVWANVNEFQWDLLMEYVESVWLLMAGSLLVCLIFLLLGGWFRLKSWWLIAPYLVGASLTGLTIGKIGSNVNYLLEFSAAVSITLAAMLAWQRPRPLIYNGLVMLLALQVFLFLPGTGNHWFTEMRLEQREEFDEIMGITRRSEGPVITDEHMGMLPLQNRAIYIQPFEVTQLARDGLWDPQPFVEAVTRQEFPLILIFDVPNSDLLEERWTPEMLAAIRQNYQEEQRIGDDFAFTRVYRPK
jgi:hypothetical protein